MEVTPVLIEDNHLPKRHKNNYTRMVTADTTVTDEEDSMEEDAIEHAKNVMSECNTKMSKT